MLPCSGHAALSGEGDELRWSISALGLLALGLAGLWVAVHQARSSDAAFDRQLLALDREARDRITVERLERELPATRRENSVYHCVRDVHDLGEGDPYATQLCFFLMSSGTSDAHGPIAMEVRYHRPFPVDPDRPADRDLTVDTPDPGVGVALVYENGSMMVSVPSCETTLLKC